MRCFSGSHAPAWEPALTAPAVRRCALAFPRWGDHVVHKCKRPVIPAWMTESSHKYGEGRHFGMDAELTYRVKYD